MAPMCASLSTMGGTPMCEAMRDMLHNESLTRGVIVSDGEATDGDPTRMAYEYKEAGIPIDCVHIGGDVRGEQTMKDIASITGGYFIKFTDVNNFSQNFKYLTPRYRGLLAEPGAARLLGASEVL